MISFVVSGALIPNVTELEAMSVFRTKGRSVFALMLLGVLLVASGVPAHAGDAEFGAEAKAFVEDMAVRAIAELTVSDLDKDKRRKKFREMMHEYFAFKSIAKWVLGRYWRRATEVERKEFLELFEQLMVTIYTERFERYSGETLTVEHAEVRSGKDALVHSRLLRPNGLKPIKVAWRVRADGHVYRVELRRSNAAPIIALSHGHEFRASVESWGGLLQGHGPIKLRVRAGRVDGDGRLDRFFSSLVITQFEARLGEQPQGAKVGVIYAELLFG